MNKKFALIGASGYIAPRHMQAIKETGGELIAAFDPFDSIGIMDSFFPNSKYFNEFERFERFVDKSRNSKLTKIDYVSVASPNFLHDSHIRFALKNDCDVICEKPLVLNPHNIHQLVKVQNETNKKTTSKQSSKPIQSHWYVESGPLHIFPKASFLGLRKCLLGLADLNERVCF